MSKKNLNTRHETEREAHRKRVRESLKNLENASVDNLPDAIADHFRLKQKIDGVNGLFAESEAYWANSVDNPKRSFNAAKTLTKSLIGKKSPYLSFTEDYGSAIQGLAFLLGVVTAMGLSVVLLVNLSTGGISGTQRNLVNPIIQKVDL